MGEPPDKQFLWDDDVELPRHEIDAQNGLMLEKQRRFRLAAEYVAEAFSAVGAVRGVLLFGSVAAPLEKEISCRHRFRRAGVEIYHECRDVDLAVRVDGLQCLNALRNARASALGRLLEDKGFGVAHHRVDVFVLDGESGLYRGRLCIFGRCPKGKFVCTAPGCGKPPFLQQLEAFEFSGEILARSPGEVLFERHGGGVF